MASSVLNRPTRPHTHASEPLVPQYSLEREPWRALRSSHAIRFSTKRRKSWSPEEITGAVKAEIIAGLEARRSIVRSYAGLKAGLLNVVYDLKRSSGESQIYDDAQQNDDDVFARARDAIAIAGSLAQQRGVLNELIDYLEADSKRLGLLVHGFAKVREERSGTIRFIFELWGKRQSFTCAELENEAATLDTVLKETRERFGRLLSIRAPAHG